jgi:alanyl-tRNA synthetase
MGGQVGDTGTLEFAGQRIPITKTFKQDRTFFLQIGQAIDTSGLPSKWVAKLEVDVPRRRAIERHHTVTHILHWALHELVSRDAAQKGSYVGPDKLTFDFSSAALTPQQKRDVEKKVNEKVAENAPVSWTEIRYVEAKKRSDIQQFFGDKYGDTVRVVQIGGEAKALNGYSMELCGGTHVRATGQIEHFHIVKEEAIAAGIRRIEAVAGEAAREWARQEATRQQEKFEMLSRKKPGLTALPDFANEDKAAAMLAMIDMRAAHLEKLEAEVRDWEKQNTKSADAELRTRAVGIANELAASHAKEKFCVAEIQNGDGKLLQAVVDVLKGKLNAPIVLAGATDGNVALIAAVPKDLTSKFQADKIIQQIAPIVGGKGGGRPEGARGAGKDANKIGDALAKARALMA